MGMKTLFGILTAVFLALFFVACGDGNSFTTCQETTVVGLRSLKAETETASFCRTIYGEVSYQYTGRCARKGCFFLYDVDENGNRVKGDSIYLSDTSAFPKKWKDPDAVHLTRVTGEYFPNKDYSCESLADQECQRAFYVEDVE